MKPIIRFGIDSFLYVIRGSAMFYGWLMFLGFFMLLMMYGAYEQFTNGMIVTNYNDQVSWGLYEAQFVFLVGVAAAAASDVPTGSSTTGPPQATNTSANTAVARSRLMTSLLQAG